MHHRLQPGHACLRIGKVQAQDAPSAPAGDGAGHADEGVVDAEIVDEPGPEDK